MNQTQTLKISSKYAHVLQALGAKAQRCDTSLTLEAGDPGVYNHCLWMCGETEKMDPAKALRWICFIQGVLFGAGALSIDSMREDNRLILEELT